MRRKLKHFMWAIRNGLPSGYTRVEWLYKAGSTNFIEVGTFLCSGFEVDIKNDNFGVTRFIGGSCQSLVSGYGIRPFYLLGNNPDKLAFCQGGGYGYNVNNFSTFTRFTCKLTRSKVLLDGVEQTSFTAYTDTPQYDEAVPVYIGQVAGNSPGRAYYYAVKIWDDTENLRHSFIPALDPTGAPCMYDLVTRKPFYNSGSGDFAYPVATTYSLRAPRPQRQYAQMTEHGIRRLYHVPHGCILSKDEYTEQNGFKVLVETPQPEEGYWRPEWRETETELICDWIETEPYDIEEE